VRGLLAWVIANEQGDWTLAAKLREMEHGQRTTTALLCTSDRLG